MGGSDAPRRLAASFQVQPAAFRGATPRGNAQMVSTMPTRGANVAAKKGAFDPTEFAKTLPGLTEKPATEGKVRFYREVELKHCRVAMLAALGYPIAEQFHPLFGGNIDTPSFSAFQQTPLETFWPAVVFLIAIPEVFSVFTFQNPVGAQPWTVRTDHSPGDLGWDPMGLKPTNPAELAEMQTKELNNGRLAMIAIAGMIVQEGVTGGKLF